MRQLWSTGWCHNRVRVVAASFMVKQLLLPWQWGLKHLWDCQIDADLECDALGWCEACVCCVCVCVCVCVWGLKRLRDCQTDAPRGGRA